MHHQLNYFATRMQEMQKFLTNTKASALGNKGTLASGKASVVANKAPVLRIINRDMVMRREQPIVPVDIIHKEYEDEQNEEQQDDEEEEKDESGLNSTSNLNKSPQQSESLLVSSRTCLQQPSTLGRQRFTTLDSRQSKQLYSKSVSKT